MAKSALITFGNEESYGLSFVGGELLEYGEEIKFFDGEHGNWADIVRWNPDFLMFSPMTTFYKSALAMVRNLRMAGSQAITVFGGHHAMACPEIVNRLDIDTVVVGPVRGSIGKILGGKHGIITTQLTTPDDLPTPARKQYFSDIPRVANRYRKFVLSMLGCPWNCSYCSSSCGHMKSMFGAKAHKEYYLKHRPINAVVKEIKEICTYDTKEIEWVDDDIFAGDEEWLLRFLGVWQREFDIPMYASTTSVSVLRASSQVLLELKKCCNVIGMGVQAIRPSSLKLFNRQWDSEDKIQRAYDRLMAYGFRVNLQGIVGLPIDDPLEDAIDTVMGMQRIGLGSICSLYPLMIYEGTEMAKLCKDFPKNENSVGDTNTGICDLKFDCAEQLKNLCKLATFIVKYGLDESLVRVLINGNYDKITQEMSMLRYKECVVDRLGDEGEQIFGDIIGTMDLKF